MSRLLGPFVEGCVYSDSIRREAERLVVRFKLVEVAGSEIVMLRNAKNDSRLPRVGSRPDYFPEFVLLDRSFRVEGTRQVDITLTYGRPDVSVQEVAYSEYVPVSPLDGEAPPPSEENIPSIAVGSSVAPVETSFDAQGQPLRVTYNGDTIAETAQVEVPVPALVFSRLEPLHPLFKSVAYTGKVNSVPFAGFPPNYWLCRSINGQLQRLANGEFAYAVTYEFQGAPEGQWKKRLFYIDTESGQVPEDAVLGNGIAEFVLYPGMDFNALNLPVPGAPTPDAD